MGLAHSNNSVINMFWVVAHDDREYGNVVPKHMRVKSMQLAWSRAIITGVSVTEKRSKICRSYTIDGEELQRVKSAKYLGITLTEKLSWREHVREVAKRAMNTLKFARRSLRNCRKTTKEKTYKALVRPKLEYSASAWDPYRKCDVEALEAVQRRTARFVTSSYERCESVTALLAELDWTTLEARRKRSRLVNLYKCVTDQNALRLPDHVQKSDRRLRQRFVTPYCRTDVYKYSYYPRTIRDWNDLPLRIRTPLAPTPAAFGRMLC